jgi:hypothetical protein
MALESPMSSESSRPVVADRNLYNQKSHTNALSRLMEIVTNSVRLSHASDLLAESASWRPLQSSLSCPCRV